jgi:hypothetical protein
MTMPGLAGLASLIVGKLARANEARQQNTTDSEQMI